jgi:endo-1,4-beta-xylanase
MLMSLGWTAPQHFYSDVPAIVTENIGDGYWVDMWVICDETDCHLFSSDDNGHLYRSQTKIEDFPEGMSDPVIAKEDSDRYALFEASNVYRIAGPGINTGNATNATTYLLIVEAIGENGRYFRSWTSHSIGADDWTPLAATESHPFAGAANVQFKDGNAWTKR